MIKRDDSLRRSSQPVEIGCDEIGLAILLAVGLCSRRALRLPASLFKIRRSVVQYYNYFFLFSSSIRVWGLNGGVKTISLR